MRIKQKNWSSQSCAIYQPRKLTKDVTLRFSSDFFSLILDGMVGVSSTSIGSEFLHVVFCFLFF